MIPCFVRKTFCIIILLASNLSLLVFIFNFISYDFVLLAMIFNLIFISEVSHGQRT